MSCPRAGCTITSITYATLGNNGGSCPSFSKGSCAVDFTANATAACVGKQACVVSSDRGRPTWDPCYGIGKYLSIAATYNFLGDGGPATSAVLRNPYGVSHSRLGDVFIADTNAHLVRKVSADSGLISTIVGIANVAGSPSNELYIAGTSTNLYYPYDVAADRSGNCYIADRYNHRIRKWTASTGMVASFAGYGGAGFNGDNIAATSAALYYPAGVTLDSGGNVYISDTNNCAIRRVDKTTNIILTIVGYYRSPGFGGDGNNAYYAYLNYPNHISFDSSNNLFIADTNNHRVRKVTNVCVGCVNTITTVAGNGVAGSAGDYRSAINANLNFPTSVVVNAAGAVFIADSGNQRIRGVGKLPGGTVVMITSVAGTGIAGYDGDGYKGAQGAKFNALHGMDIDLLGNIYIADSGNGAIRYLVYPTTGASPTSLPTSQPSSRPSHHPTNQPSTHPSEQPTRRPSAQPSRQPSAQPSRQPFSRPSSQPSRQPSAQPSRQPTIRPTSQPSRQPSVQPSRQPSVQPSSQPSRQPSVQPSSQPSTQPTARPSRQPTQQPTQQPTRQPTRQPTSQPTRQVCFCVYSHIPLLFLIYSNLFLYYFFLSVVAYPSTNSPTYTTAHTRTHIHSYGSTELRTIPTALISAQ